MSFYGPPNYTVYNSTNVCLYSVPEGWRTFNVPPEVEIIRPNAFSKASNTLLQVLFVQSSLTKIRHSAFCNCSRLLWLNFSQCSNLREIGKNVFYGCSSLSYLVLPLSIQSVKDYAFSQCKSLTTLFIDNSSELNYIGKRAFENTAITTFFITNNLKFIGDNAFYDSKMKNFELNKWHKYYTNHSGALYTKDLKTLVHYPKELISDQFNFTKETENVQQFAFININSINKIKLSPSIKELKNGTFANSHIQSFDFTSAINLESIGPNCFYKNDRIQTINLESNNKLKTIGEYSFYGCSSLKHVKLSTSVEKISDFSFTNCICLENVEFPKECELQHIGKCSFNNTNISIFLHFK